MIKNVSLDDTEWSQILAVLSKAPWDIANPLLMKIGEQLRARTDNIEPIPKDASRRQ